MAVTIQLTVSEDDAVQSFQELTQAMKRADAAAEGLRGSAKGVGDAFDDVRKKTKSIDLTTKLMGAKAAFDAVVGAGRGVLGVVDNLAAKGSPAFVVLKNRLDAVGGSFAKLAESDSVQIAAARTANAIEGIIIPLAGKVADAWVGAQNSITRAIARAGEYVGAFPEGTADEAADMTSPEGMRRELEAVKAEAQRLKAMEQRKALTESLAKLDQQFADASYERGLKYIHTREKINRLIEQEEKALRTAADAGKLTDEDRVRGLNRIAQLRKRNIEIIAEETKAAEDAYLKEKKFKDDLRKAGEDFARDMERADMERSRREADAARQRIDAIKAQAQGSVTLQQTQQSIVDIQRNLATEAQKFREQYVNAFVSGDVKGAMAAADGFRQAHLKAVADVQAARDKLLKQGGPLENIRAGITDQDKAQEVLRSRLEKARQEALDKAKANQGIQTDQFGRAIGGTKHEQAQNQRELNRMTREAEARTRRQFGRDMKGGRIGEEEVTQATNNLTNRTIDHARQTGKIGAETAAGLKAAADAQQEAANQIQEHAQTINALQDSFSQIQDQLAESSGATRRRAQSR